MGESRGGVSLNGILALICGVGLLLVRDMLVSLSALPSRTATNAAIWVAALVLLLIGTCGILGRRIRPGYRGVGRGGRRVRRAPREGLLYLGLMAALLVGSFLGGDNLLMLLVALMIGPWLLNAWASGTLLWRCNVRRVVPDRVMVGEVVSVELVVENRKMMFPSWLVLASDQVENDVETIEARVLFARVPAGGQRSGYYRLRPGRRGRYRLGPIELSTRFPLGLIERGLVFHRPEELRVYPRLGHVSAGWCRESAEPAGAVSRQARRQGGSDDQLQQLREFRSGDNPRAVHWRTSARRGELMVREFEERQHQNLDLVLDLWQPEKSGESDLQRVELAVSLAASLCVETLRQAGDARVRLTVCGMTVTELPETCGPTGIHHVLDLLATVQAGSGPQHPSVLSDPTSPRFRGATVTTREVGDDSHGEEQAAAWSGVGSGEARTVVRVDPQRLPNWFSIAES